MSMFARSEVVPVTNFADSADGEQRDQQFRFYYGAASGSSRKALRQLEEPNVMLNYATKMNEPWGGIERLFIDSGGYSFMKGKGEYATDDATYLDFIERHTPELFALRDYPCEPDVLAEHGRRVEDHQERTLSRHRSLLDLLEHRGVNATPLAVLQGWSINDYLRCVDLFREHGVLTDYVGIGSVCRRNQEPEIRRIILAIRDALPARTRLHAFGVKSSVLRYPDVRDALDSADSQSYDMQARWGTLHAKGAGSRTFRDSALEYLKQKRRIDTLLASDADAETQQTALSEVC
jgi:hypothetical protein